MKRNPDVELFESILRPSERRRISGLRTPFHIQGFLDKIPYSAEQTYRCPLRVLRDSKAHCFDGAVFSAALLRRLGYPPVILYMIANNDDDHCLALFKVDGRWGAVAKSNYVGLRFREPVYRSLRELAMSYFEDFFNVNGQKSLRSYTTPLHLRTFDKYGWMIHDEPMDRIARRLDQLRTTHLLTRRMIRRLSPVDPLSHKAGLLGANPSGLYKPD